MLRSSLLPPAKVIEPTRSPPCPCPQVSPGPHAAQDSDCLLLGSEVQRGQGCSGCPVGPVGTPAALALVKRCLSGGTELTSRLIPCLLPLLGDAGTCC